MGCDADDYPRSLSIILLKSKSLYRLLNVSKKKKKFFFVENNVFSFKSGLST